MKKIFLTLFAAVLICVSVAFSVSAQTYFELNPEQITSVTPGENLSIDVTVDNITTEAGLESVDFELTYSSNLTFSSVSAALPENWDFWTPVSNTASHMVRVAAVDEGDSANAAKEDGDITFTFNFTVASDFASGDTISLSFAKVGGTDATGNLEFVSGIGNALTYEYVVKPVQLVITKEPYKDTYTAGQKFYSNGLAVAVLYSNGVQEAVTDYTVIAPDMTLFGEQDVVVSWNDLYATFKITVNAPTLNSISVTPPSKTVYTVGETLNTVGMVVTANYANSITKDVTDAATVDTTALNTKGTVTVTVTFEGLTATFTVTVNEKSSGAGASGEISGTDITWEIADGVLTISGTGAIPDYTSAAAGRAPWASYAAKVTSIVIEEGITEIGNYGIAYLTNATSVTVPASVTYVGQLFMRNTKIAEIELPGVELVENAAFNGAASLTKVIFSESLCDVRGEAFATTQVVTVEAPAASYAFNYADYYKTMYPGKATLTAVSDGTTAAQPILAFGKIGDNAFFAIYEIAANNNQMVISGSGTTYNYWFISEKRIQMDKEQGGNNFAPLYYMYEDEATQPIVRNILTLTVREGITSIGNYSFYRCLKARNVEILGPVTWIGNAAFQACEGIRSLTLPETCTRLGDYVFNGCRYLGSITVPGTMTQIGKEIFKSCLVDRTEEKRPESANLLVYTTDEFTKNYMNEVYPNVDYRVVVRAPK